MDDFVQVWLQEKPICVSCLLLRLIELEFLQLVKRGKYTYHLLEYIRHFLCVDHSKPIFHSSLACRYDRTAVHAHQIGFGVAEAVGLIFGNMLPSEPPHCSVAQWEIFCGESVSRARLVQCYGGCDYCTCDDGLHLIVPLCQNIFCSFILCCPTILALVPIHPGCPPTAPTEPDTKKRIFRK